MTNSKANKIGIIGGGISGLTAAFLLKNKGFDVSLFEKSARVGGNIQTVNIDGFKIEYAPNSLLKSPRLVDLIKDLNLANHKLQRRMRRIKSVMFCGMVRLNLCR